jgi:hypothetical protein
VPASILILLASWILNSSVNPYPVLRTACVVLPNSIMMGRCKFFGDCLVVFWSGGIGGRVVCDCQHWSPNPKQMRLLAFTYMRWCGGQRKAERSSALLISAPRCGRVQEEASDAGRRSRTFSRQCRLAVQVYLCNGDITLVSAGRTKYDEDLTGRRSQIWQLGNLALVAAGVCRLW